MPQMSPLLWAFLFIVMLVTVLTVSMNMYFMMTNKNMMNSFNDDDLDKKNFYWKW